MWYLKTFRSIIYQDTANLAISMEIVTLATNRANNSLDS